YIVVIPASFIRGSRSFDGVVKILFITSVISIPLILLVGCPQLVRFSIFSPVNSAFRHRRSPFRSSKTIVATEAGYLRLSYARRKSTTAIRICPEELRGRGSLVAGGRNRWPPLDNGLLARAGVAAYNHLQNSLHHQSPGDAHA